MKFEHNQLVHVVRVTSMTIIAIAQYVESPSPHSYSMGLQTPCLKLVKARRMEDPLTTL